MDLDLKGENPRPPEILKKYRQAGYGFLLLNVIYAILALEFLPPFNLELTALGVTFFLVLMGLLSIFIFKVHQMAVRVLAVIFAARFIFSVYSVSGGDTFAAVPYLLPCLALTCYLLGRAGWDWP